MIRIKEIPTAHRAERPEAPAVRMKEKDSRRAQRQLTSHTITEADLHRHLSKNSTPTSARTMTYLNISSRRSSKRTVSTETEKKQLIWLVPSFEVDWDSVAYQEA